MRRRLSVLRTLATLLPSSKSTPTGRRDISPAHRHKDSRSPLTKESGCLTLQRPGRTTAYAIIAPQLWLFEVKRGVLECGREHDERRFAARFAKVLCAAQNAELRHNPGLGQRGDASKNELTLLVKHCG